MMSLAMDDPTELTQEVMVSEVILVFIYSKCNSAKQTLVPPFKTFFMSYSIKREKDMSILLYITLSFQNRSSSQKLRINVVQVHTDVCLYWLPQVVSISHQQTRMNYGLTSIPRTLSATNHIIGMLRHP